ncbi:MAG TPA: hypothetical protein PKK10_15775 [Woeseiaceae bacterium]|nr:hypothetical protein [Woeseiaceae bacterium]
MAYDPNQQVLRLRKKHEPGQHERPTAADGARLVQAQSVGRAILAGIMVCIVFAVLWSILTETLERFLPWVSLFLGVLVGLAVRRGGQGFNWRFPLLAAVVTLAGVFAAIVYISAGTTADELGTNRFIILWNVTTMTWPVFFDEVLNAADFVYAFFAALIAASLALRPLDRREFQAVRLWREQQTRGQ